MDWRRPNRVVGGAAGVDVDASFMFRAVDHSQGQMDLSGAVLAVPIGPAATVLRPGPSPAGQVHSRVSAPTVRTVPTAAGNGWRSRDDPTRCRPLRHRYLAV